jgi:hypothetical protein
MEASRTPSALQVWLPKSLLDHNALAPNLNTSTLSGVLSLAVLNRVRMKRPTSARLSAQSLKINWPSSRCQPQLTVYMLCKHSHLSAMVFP